ncbi:MAG: hypothetical protein H6Q70_2901 [Firmicutes bacterium]|nr:hypothetical protein [Bacillota bacterium]
MSQLNRESLARTLILLGFFLLLFSLIITDQLTLYVHPRIVMLIEMSAGLLFMMFLLQGWKLSKTWNKPTEECKHWKYMPFVFTLLVALILPNTSLNASLVSNKGVNSQVTTEISKKDYRPLAPEMRQTDLIKVDDNNFVDVMSELYRYPQEYVGKQIEMSGFVFKDESTPQDQFSLIRYVVGCCVADALPSGPSCEINNATEYSDGSWYQIQGTIENSEENGKAVPVIKVTWTRPIHEKSSPYIFR